MTRILRTSFLGLAAVAFAGGGAYAYIPPSQYIVRTIAAKHSGIRGVKLESRVEAISRDKPSGAQFKQITLYDAQNGVLRSSAVDDSGKVLYVAERKMPEVPIVDLMEFGSKADSLIAALKGSEVPIKTEEELATMTDENERYASETTSIGRIKTQFAWIIGESSKPQLWVEKDTFLPIRLIVKDDRMPELSGSGPVEIHFENYRFVREFPVSRLINVSRNGDTFLREEAGDVVVNPPLAELKKSVTPGYTDAGNSADSGVRDLIKQYYSALR